MTVTRARTRIAGSMTAVALLAIVFVAWPGPSLALTCGESGETLGVIESVLDGTHTRSDRWQVIAAGTVTSIEPLNGAYETWGAWIEMDVAFWFRGGDGSTLRFFDPPAGSSGVGFQVEAPYLVLASDDLNWEGRLATGLCELTYRLPDMERIERLAAEFGARMPDTALPEPARSPSPVAGIFVLMLALLSGGAVARVVGLGERSRR